MFNRGVVVHLPITPAVASDAQNWQPYAQIGDGFPTRLAARLRQPDRLNRIRRGSGLPLEPSSSKRRTLLFCRVSPRRPLRSSVCGRGTPRLIEEIGQRCTQEALVADSLKGAPQLIDHTGDDTVGDGPIVSTGPAECVVAPATGNRDLDLGEFSGIRQAKVTRYVPVHHPVAAMLIPPLGLLGSAVARDRMPVRSNGPDGSCGGDAASRSSGALPAGRVLTGIKPTGAALDSRLGSTSPPSALKSVASAT